MTLEERINWMVDNRAGGNQRALDRLAELPEGTIAAIKSRLRKKGGGLNQATAVALSTKARVSYQWLVLDVGAPDDESPVPISDAEAEQLAPEVLGRRSDWPRLVAGARALDPSIPGWVFDYLARRRAGVTDTPTPEEVKELARLTMRLVAPP